MLGMAASRLLAAGFLVFATYNPGGPSYVRWLREGAPDPVWQGIVGALLLVAYGVAVPLTLRALGPEGVALVASATTVAMWLLLHAGLIALGGPRAAEWVGLTVATCVIGAGLSWLAILVALTGQSGVRDLSRF